MGGDYYDREVNVADSPQGFSSNAAYAMSRTSMHSSMDPRTYRDLDLESKKMNPIVFALDVTGSMGDWSKIIYDKLPMFYGQIMMHNYLTEPSVSICAIGDYKSDKSPLQVSTFAEGNNIDKVLPNLWLEAGGGNNQKESYELAAYFYTECTDVSSSVLPFLFMTGDEGFYKELDKKHIKTYTGRDEKTNPDGKALFQNLMKKYNVFLLKKPYSDEDDEEIIYEQWKDTIGEERVLKISHPKACVDVMLGAIAITSGKDLDSYLKDMEERRQEQSRIEEVRKALELYYKKLTNKEIRRVYNGLNEVKDKADKLLNAIEDREKFVFYQKLKELRRKLKKQVPPQYICPITKEIYLEPVFASDGRVYEKKALEAWCDGNTNSPLDEYVPLDKEKTKNNVALRREIQAWAEDCLTPKEPEKKESKCVIF
jgi:hypothetical protein